MTEPLIAPNVPVEVQSQILVVDDRGILTIINPEDEVTAGDDLTPIRKEDVVRILSGDSGVYTWVDVWQDHQAEDGERSRLARRIFAPKVNSLTRAWIFPDAADMVQA